MASHAIPRWKRLCVRDVSKALATVHLRCELATVVFVEVVTEMDDKIEVWVSGDKVICVEVGKTISGASENGVT